MASQSSIEHDIAQITDCLQTLTSKLSAGQIPGDVDRLGSFSKLLIDTSCAVRSSRNTLAPVNRLPPEILSTIFGLCSIRPFVSAYPAHAPGVFYAPQVLETLVMPVCRLWREIALSSATLWADLALFYMQMYPFCTHFARNRSAPLNFYSNFGGEIVPYLLKGQADRLRALHIRGSPDTYMTIPHIEEILSCLPRAAHCLEEFFLHGYAWPDMKSSLVQIFSGSAPRLRILSLADSPFLPTDHYPNLRELYLLTDSITVSSADLLTVLRGAPMLEHVYIRARMLDPPGVGASGDRSVTLAHLRKLVLHLGADPSPLLSLLILCPTCLIRLEELDVREVSRCVAALERHLDTRQLTRLSLAMGRVLLAPEYEGSLYITLCNASVDSGLQVGLRYDYDHSFRFAFLRAIPEVFRSSPLYANVKELTISARRDLVDYTFLNSLPSLTTLNHIFDRHSMRKARHSNAARVPILAQRSPDGTGICTGLRTLYFIECGVEELKDAREIVDYRRREGYPIARLGIACAAHLEQDAYAFGKLVDHLDLEFYDSSGYEDVRDGLPEGGWRTHSGRARFHWPQWPRFH
ncbi:hypothetical protein BV20DRAFT_977466 [Pilatotrama ljubarskyi]|nr:hypothetical protein BV20DRAFT_977466 [Pilatotrama ljubarskyi]